MCPGSGFAGADLLRRRSPAASSSSSPATGQPAPPPALDDHRPRDRSARELPARGPFNAEICDRLLVSHAKTKTHVA